VIVLQLDSCLEHRKSSLFVQEDLHQHSQHLIWVEPRPRLLEVVPRNRHCRCVDRDTSVYHRRHHDADVHGVISLEIWNAVSREIWNAVYGGVSGEPDYLLENSFYSYFFRASFCFLSNLCLCYSFDRLLVKQTGSWRVLLYLAASDFGVKAVRFVGILGAPSSSRVLLYLAVSDFGVKAVRFVALLGVLSDDLLSAAVD
jgi:hypothetical protein